MFEKLLRMYIAYMLQDVRSPVPHMFGPPGVGKSTSVEKLAEVLGVRLRILNVSRISPLELEGVQMPQGTGEEMILKLLHSPFWKDLQEGDIVHLEEFLRGFPEVYNGLLDILTSREVAGYKLPRVFIVASSNTHITYDPALEDRLIHLPVDDPRTSKPAYEELKQILVNELGLMEETATYAVMHDLLDTVVCPAYAVLDSLNLSNVASPLTETRQTKSLRNLIGQVRLRQIVTKELRELLEANNSEALSRDKIENVIILDENDGTTIKDYLAHEPELHLFSNTIHENNRLMNLQLIKLREAKVSLSKSESLYTEEEEIYAS